MLYQSPLASSEGQPSYIWRNEMDMKNTGIEFEISGDIIKKKNVVWNASLNLTHYKNQLTRLPASKPADLYPDGYQAGSYWRKIGGSLYNYYMYQYAGVDPESGLPLYNKYTDEYDDEGNKIGETVTTVNIASEGTRRQIGKSAIPDLTGGFSTSLTLYGFDVSIATAFQLGGYVQDSYYAALMTPGAAGHNFHKDMFDRWTPTHTNTNIPALYYDKNNAGIEANSDFFLTRASYFAITNLTFGYNLPKSLISNWGFEKLRVYFSAENLMMVSRRKGLDPRQSFSGSTGYPYSPIRSCSFGLSLTF
jgi:hypothetical protein